MPDSASINEYQPSLGTETPHPTHLSNFLNWAEFHKVTSISLLVSALVVDTRNVNHKGLLGGLLQFICNQETAEILSAWSLGRPRIAKLSKFSAVLGGDFPDLPTPFASPQIQFQFPGCIPFNFLAAMLGVRRPPGLDIHELYKLACFRCWVLLKALDFCVEKPSEFDLSVQHASDFIRMAFDEKGDQKKRTWILNLAEPSNDLSQYEINLEVGTGRADVSVAGADSCKRAIRSLLANSHKPLLLPQFESAGHGLLNSAIAEFTVDSTPDERSTQLELSNSSSNLYRFTIKESATPPETALESRAISFQSAEDHQFLPYSWNRPRPDELVILGKELKRQLTNDNAADKLLAAITVIALLCHRSLDTVSTVRLGKYSSEHWQLDPDSLVLHKTPTRRQNNWQPIGDSIEWVQKSSERWDLTLLDPVAQILRNQLRKTVNPVDSG